MRIVLILLSIGLIVWGVLSTVYNLIDYYKGACENRIPPKQITQEKPEPEVKEDKKIKIE